LNSEKLSKGVRGTATVRTRMVRTARANAVLLSVLLLPALAYAQQASQTGAPLPSSVLKGRDLLNTAMIAIQLYLAYLLTMDVMTIVKAYRTGDPNARDKVTAWGIQAFWSFGGGSVAEYIKRAFG
jgi:hypothetical protein